jgi:hypothetical protein
MMLIMLTVVCDMMHHSLIDTDVLVEFLFQSSPLFYPDDGAGPSKSLVNIYQATQLSQTTGVYIAMKTS